MYFIYKTTHTGNDDHINRHIIVFALRLCFQFLNLIHNVHALNHLPEHAITVFFIRVSLIIKIRIVNSIDKELSGSGVRIGGSRHSKRAAQIFQAVAGFIANRLMGGLFFVTHGIAAALYHEVFDHTVKNSVLVKFLINIF